MNMTTLGKIQSMLAEQFGFAPEQLAPEQVLADLGVESLGMVEFMFELENAFSIEFDSQGEPPRTVADLVALVEAHLPTKQTIGA